MKTLNRIPSEGKLTGLCAGLARYFDIDVTIVRLIILAVVVLSGVIPGTVFYFITALITPTKGEKHA